MVRPLQPVDRTRRDGWGADRDHRLGSSLGWGKGTCRRCDDPPPTPACHRPHRHCRYSRCRMGDGPLCGRGWKHHHSAAGRASRRPRFLADEGPPPRRDHCPRVAAGRTEAGRRSLSDAARCTGPPIWRNRGAAPRSGPRQPARAVVAARRGAEPAGAVELRRADYRARRSDAGDGAAHRGSRPSLGAGRDGGAATRSRLSPRRRPGRADPPRHRPPEPRAAPSCGALQGAARHNRPRPRHRRHDPRRLRGRAPAGRADRFPARRTEAPPHGEERSGSLHSSTGSAIGSVSPHCRVWKPAKATSRSAPRYGCGPTSPS